MGSYGSDIGRAHAIHMSWEGGKIAGRADLIKELEQPCPHFTSDGTALRKKHLCPICWKEVTEVSNGK